MSSAKNFVILGGAGDLAERLLVPGIAQYASLNDLDITIVGAGHNDHDDYASFIRNAASGADAAVADRLAANTEFVVTDATKTADLQALLDGWQSPILYFALSPSTTRRAIAALKDVNLADGIVFAMEKPFGTGCADARELNRQLLDLTDESHIVRVDHFLALSGTLNFQVIRSTNRLITSSWSNEDVEAIHIVFNESIALEGRAEFYESTGAANDMLQSHLLQTLARILSDEDSSPENILRAIAPTDKVRRGRYTEGEVKGQRVPAYVDEVGVDPSRNTETWFRVVVDVQTPRWQGVPITLESGKAFGKDQCEIIVTFKRNGTAPANNLTLGFENGGIEITLNSANLTSSGGAELTLHSNMAPVKMSAYGRVVKGIIDGVDHLKIPAEAAELGWDVMEKINDRLDQATLEEYAAGTVSIE